jgi:peptidoglycan-N-acetylglucosamine deacetylase
VSEPTGSSVVAVRPTAASAVLTYDDGPTPGITDQLLPVLADAGATATFFVLLTRVRTSPALLAEIQAAGHEIGLHGPDHRRLTTMPSESLPARFRDAKAELEDLSGASVRWSRPPYGAQDSTAWRAARTAGLTPVLWSIACQDWETLPADDYLTELRAGDPTGCVVLLHDGYADARDGVDDGPAPVLDRPGLTRRVLDHLGAAGLTTRALGSALESAEAVYLPWLEERGDPS